MIETHKELYVAKKYINKLDNARSKNIEFSLSLSEFSKIVGRKKCFYTGVTMRKPTGLNSTDCNDLTLDRIDSNKGYVSGNVVACTRAANNLKGIWENPLFDLTVENARDTAIKTIATLAKLKLGKE